MTRARSQPLVFFFFVFSLVIFGWLGKTGHNARLFFLFFSSVSLKTGQLPRNVVFNVYIYLGFLFIFRYGKAVACFDHHTYLLLKGPSR